MPVGGLDEISMVLEAGDGGIKRRITGIMAKLLAAHLVDHRGIKVCSVCTQPFAAVSGPSLSLAFRKHVEEAHAVRKKSHDVNQAASRIVERAD